MKRYLLFGFDNYRANGGLDDLIGSFDTVEDCNDCIEKFPYNYDEFQIFDRIEGGIVAQ